jgi:hypothetical protein
MPRWAIAAVLAVGAWFLGTHFLHVFTEVINWDEFALLERADRTLRFGKVVGDGRAGLVTIALVPFVRDCIDATRSVIGARLLWQGITLIYLVGIYFLVRRWFIHSGRPQEGHAQGLLAVALLAFLPAFVVWSVQVRTDQVALAAAVWAGVLLLSTSKRQSAAAGALLGVGLLCTQKGVYGIALVGLLFLTATGARLSQSPSRVRGEVRSFLTQLGIACAAAVIVIGAYTLLVPDVSKLASRGMVLSSLETMRFSRISQGYRIYTVHAGRLVVHWVLFGVLVAWSVHALRHRDRGELPVVATCWLVLALGLIVVLVHGSSFPYFIMTAGLFPALALSMAAGRPLALAGRLTWPITTLLIIFAALQSARESIQMLEDTQWEQRETLRLVYDSPLKHRRGYHVEGALLCMRDPAPLPTMFSPGIWHRFHESPQAMANRAQFIEEFRARPIAYIVESYRLSQFPPEIRGFWSEHYIRYARSLYVAGFDIAGPRQVDIIVPGKYRWDADPTSPDAELEIGAIRLNPGAEVELPVGAVTAQAIGDQALGQLMLADLPRPERDGDAFFYSRRQIRQLGGRL